MDIVDKIILKLIDSGEPHVASAAASHLGLSRQAISARIRRMEGEQLVSSHGRGRGRSYSLPPILSVRKSYKREGLDEFHVWRESVSPLLADLPKNVLDICSYGVTEMVNNAVDHSEGTDVVVRIQRTALAVTVRVSDNGEGIFHRLQRLLGLYDAREAILELAKGKLTTDPARHTGEGVFFSSRVFDRFSILSRNLFFSHDSRREDWLIDGDDDTPGTMVAMELANDSPRILREVFSQFAEPDDFSFAKTIVPVRLAQHEGESLVSRSQAKRLTNRFDRFKTVVLDFGSVEEIGQSFADEIFRVFLSSHPSIALIPINMTDAVRNMVSRAYSNVKTDG
jgi:anti-sigma regulatory factor (Ser/Thr protein kinase)/biotin operon repressor